MRKALATLAVTLGLIAGLGTVQAEAQTPAPEQARKSCVYGVCSQIKHRENDTSYFNVKCQHVGWQEWITLWSGGVSGCGQYFFMVQVPDNRELWCRTLGVQEPDRFTFGPGYTTWTSSRSLNCRVVWIA